MPAYLALVWWYLWWFGHWVELNCCWESRSASSSWPGERGCRCVRKWKHSQKLHTLLLLPIIPPVPYKLDSPPSLPPAYRHDSLLPLRMLQQLMEHLCLLHVSTSACGWSNRILRYHGLRLQVHVPMHAGIVPVWWEGWRWSHVTHVLWCHGPDHVRI